MRPSDAQCKSYKQMQRPIFWITYFLQLDINSQKYRHAKLTLLEYLALMLSSIASMLRFEKSSGAICTKSAILVYTACESWSRTGSLVGKPRTKINILIQDTGQVESPWSYSWATNEKRWRKDGTRFKRRSWNQWGHNELQSLQSWTVSQASKNLGRGRK